jgi:RNA polymerase sigma-70 factor, ECF subfamily
VTSNESELLGLALKGDDDAFASLVELYQTPVYNMCYRMLGTPQDAEDAAQETFWRAYQALHRYDRKRSFITWVLSIAAHYCIDQHRRRKLPTFALELLPEESVPFLAPGPENLVAQSEEDRHLHTLLNQLKPQDRAAIVLRYWYDFSEKEISQSLSLSVSAVKSRLHRARRQLAQIVSTNKTQSLCEEAV